MVSVKGAFESHRKLQWNFYTYKKPIIAKEDKIKLIADPSVYQMHMCFFGNLLGYADWLGPGEQQPYGSRIPETARSGTFGGDEPAALQTGWHAQ